MLAKQNTHIFNVLVLGLAASVAFSVWSVSRSLSLITPLSTSTSPGATIVAEAPATPAASLTPVEEPPVDQLSQPLQKTVDNFIKAEPNDYGIFVKHLSINVVVSANPKSSFISASLYKPFAAIEALKLVDDGKLSLEQQLAAAGGRTVKQCIQDTITVSDNPCGHALLGVTNASTAQGLSSLRADGFKHTDLRGSYPTTTAQDVATLFEQLYTGDLLSKSSTKLLLNALKQQKVNDRLPTGLPSGTTIAHKTGDLEGVVHDAGIVYSDESGDYIISILSGADTSGRTLAQRYARFGELTKSIHELMIKYAPVVAAESS